MPRANRSNRRCAHGRALRPGVLPALRSQAVGGATAVRAARRALRRRVVRERGYRVALFDAMLAESEAEWAAALDRHRPRVAVIYEDSFNYLSKMCLLRMRQAALTMIDCGARARHHGDRRRLGRQRSSGDLSRSRRRTSWSPAKARSRWSRSLDALDRRRRHAEPASVDVRGHRDCADSDGRDRANARRATSSAISMSCRFRPGISSTSIAIARSGGARHGYFSMNIATTRGCPYHCNWCAKPIYGQRYTARSPEHVVERDRVAEATPISPTTCGSPTTSSA